VTKKAIVDAWATIRRENQSIPDEVLDFMKDSALQKLAEINAVSMWISDEAGQWDFKMEGDYSMETKPTMTKGLFAQIQEACEVKPTFNGVKSNVKQMLQCSNKVAEDITKSIFKNKK